MLRRQWLKVTAGGAMGFIAGCDRQNDRPGTVFEERDEDLVVLVAIDTSGSFEELMVEKGEGFRFCLEACDQYFRSGIGSGDRLVVAQLSGTDMPLLFDGEPFELRKKFPTPAAFRQQLVKKSDPRGSRIYDGLSEGIRYVLKRPEIVQRTARPCVLVLSDMLNNYPGAEESERKCMEALGTLANANGLIGIYFCHQHLLFDWQERLARLGFKAACVEASIVGKPSLPRANA